MLAPNQIDQIILSIERTQRAIYVFCCLTILVLLSCASYGCLYRQICHTSDDINVPPYTSHTFLPASLVIIVLCFFSYHSAKYIHINYLGPLRFIILVFLVIITTLTIGEFIAGLSLTNTDRDSVWGKLPPLAKNYYDYSESNMNDEYMNNIIYLFIVQIAACVLLLGVLITVWILYSKTPMGYLPRMQNENKRELFGPSLDDQQRIDGNQALDRSADPLNQPIDPQRNDDYRSRNQELRPRNEDNEPINPLAPRRPLDDRPAFTQEIREDNSDYPMPTSNPFLRRTNN